ncbi:hypothetical protein Q0F98_36855 [Paenibacillus amylolyticus]|nr:hypothetical protein Q0F98_36855 [Paenibacillus amylolyticus]
MMNSTIKKHLFIWGASFLLLSVLAACSRSESSPSQEPVKTNEQTTKSYTTQTDEVIEIPTQPQRVIYLGSTLGDLLAMDIPVVGANLIHASKAIL